MSEVARLNRELMRLDGALRSGSVDREQYRAQRRRLLLDFEERQITTAPGADAAGELSEPVTVPGPAAAALPSTPRPAPSPAPTAAMPASSADGGASRGAALGKIVIALIVIALLGLAAWWMLGPGASEPAASTSIPVAAPSTPASGDLPQDVATRLTLSAWTSFDLADFQSRWSQLAPDAVRAASDDPRIWLLRGETDRRLREAREAASIANTPESQQRVELLEQVQAAIRPI